MFHKKEIRCRNFHDDGEPINQGCKRGTNCGFVHPNDPAWAHTSRRQNSDVNSNRSGPSDLPGKPRNGSWGGPPIETASKDWDTSLWGSQSSARKDATAASPTWRVSNDWNNTSDKGETSKSGTKVGWGTTDPTDGWGVDTSGGWGTTDFTDGWGVDTSGGWGSGGGGRWGSGANEGGANVGEVDKTSTVSSGNDPKGRSKERQSEDVQMRDPSPPRTLGSFKPSSLSHNTQESAPRPLAQNTTPPSTASPKPARPIPLPLPSRQKKSQLFDDGNLMKLALQSVKNKDAGQVQDKQNSSSVRGPKGRADLFSQVIKRTSTVVFQQVELQRAQRAHARWKRTQESAQYERASPATRVILDGHRAGLNLRVQEAKRRLERALAALVDLPDFASPSRNHKTPGPIITKQTIAAYTAELRDWFSDLELHKRIRMEKAAAQADLPPEPVQDTPVQPQLTARQLVERGNWSWNDIRTATNELDARLLTTAEHLYSDAYTTIDDLKDQASGLQDPCPINSSTTTTRNHFDAVSATASLVGDNLSAQAIRTAELISKIHALEQERERLDNETRAMNELCAETEVRFSEFEQWERDDKSKIHEMGEQLQTLLLRHKPSKTSTIATLQPAQLDNILLQMRPFVIEHLQKEVQPVFDALRSRCLENHEGMKNLIEELVTPALVMTDDICHRVSTLSSDEDEAVH